MSASSPTAIGDCELVEQVLRGERMAFDRIVGRYWRLVYTIGYAYVVDPEIAEDLTQEVFLRVYLHLESYDRNRPFVPWLSRITRNLGINWARAGQRASSVLVMLPEEDLARLGSASDQESEMERMERQERAELARMFVSRLPPDQRELVLLHYMEELNQKEIAQRLGLHPATVGRQLKKALRRLRGEMAAAFLQGISAVRARNSLLTRTLAVIGAAASVSGPTKSLLLSAAGGLQQLGTAATVNASSAGTLGFLLPFMLWLARLGVLALAGTTTLCGVNYARREVNWSRLFHGSSAAPRVTEAVNVQNREALMSEVRDLFAVMQQRARTGDLERLIDCYDLRTWGRVTGMDPPAMRSWVMRRQAGMARLIAASAVQSVSIDQEASIDVEIRYRDGRPTYRLQLPGPIVHVTAGDWQGRFVRNAGEWKLLDQRITGESAGQPGIMDMIQIHEVQ